MTIYEFSDRKDDSFLSQEMFGYDLWYILVMLTIVFVIFLILSMCWNYCAKDDKDTELHTAEETKSQIIVREVRPGLLVIQGNSPDETARVIREYETIRHQMAHYHNYGGCAHAEQTTSGIDPLSSWSSCSSFPASAPTAAPTRVNRTSGSTPQLIDLNTDQRPPPYAPVN